MIADSVEMTVAAIHNLVVPTYLNLMTYLILFGFVVKTVVEVVKAQFLVHSWLGFCFFF